MWFVVIAGAGFLAYVGMGQLDYEFVYERPTTLVAENPDDQPIEPVVPVEQPSEVPAPVEPDTPTEEPVETPSEASSPAGSLASQNQDVTDRLGRLITDNIQMRVGSFGTRVATVQMFLNLYDGENVTPDNDYGPGTKRRVEVFQKEVGIDADGLAGPQTYQKMIDWLRAN